MAYPFSPNFSNRKKLRSNYYMGTSKPRFPLGDQFFRANKQKNECDWVVMSSVFVASQSSCFFLCSREQIRAIFHYGRFARAVCNTSRVNVNKGDSNSTFTACTRGKAD